MGKLYLPITGNMKDCLQNNMWYYHNPGAYYILEPIPKIITCRLIVSNSLHNSVDIKIRYILQILYFVTFFLDFTIFLVYSNQAIFGCVFLCDRVMSAVCNLPVSSLLHSEVQVQ